MFNALMERAEFLESRLETEWAEENSALYDEFADEIESAWENDDITDGEFNELALIAFYDFTGDLKGEWDED